MKPYEFHHLTKDRIAYIYSFYAAVNSFRED